jgi:hypothetical protein
MVSWTYVFKEEQEISPVFEFFIKYNRVYSETNGMMLLAHGP